MKAGEWEKQEVPESENMQGKWVGVAGPTVEPCSAMPLDVLGNPDSDRYVTSQSDASSLRARSRHRAARFNGRRRALIT